MNLPCFGFWQTIFIIFVYSWVYGYITSGNAGGTVDLLFKNLPTGLLFLVWAINWQAPGTIPCSPISS